MTSSRIIFFIVSAFIAGNLILVFLHYNTEKNINNLIGGNQALLNEFAVSEELKTLENNVVLVESKIKGMVTTGDTSYVKGLNQQIANIQSHIDKLQKISDNDSTAIYIDKLDRLVNDKLRFSNEIVQVFTQRGKAAAEQVLAAQNGTSHTDSIQLVAHNIRHLRRSLLTQFTNTIDSSVEKLQWSGTVIIFLVLIVGAGLFWYIINTIRTQNRLILQIRSSEKKLQDAVRVKENFLANMSHEIRTPLNAIVGFTRLLQNKKLDEESRLYVQTIQQSGENLVALVNDILDLSKIEAGVIRIETAPFSLHELVQSIETMFSAKAKEKGLQLETTIDQSLPDTLEGDATRLMQILVNLVGNALKFTAKGNISIRMMNEGVKDGSVILGIEVRDTGIGIEHEKLDEVFGRFEQANDQITREYGGTGLGLAIVKELVELQQGNIRVTSQPRKGTIFHLVIPFKISGKIIPTKIASTETVHLAGINILLVEDNEVNQTLLKHLFRNWNVGFDTASNGTEALQKLRTNSYDLVLMDIQMPQMDGYTATRQIRHHLKINTPIVAMTAHAMAGEREKCLRAGMNEYIAKPINEEQLKKLIVQFVSVKTLPPLQPETGSSAVQHNYQHINLDYIKEVAAGNAAFEKEVTAQFIEGVPAQLATMEEAWQNGDVKRLKQIAHNLKTTVSVMGLNAELQPYLDGVENSEATADLLKDYIENIKRICNNALPEAKDYLASLSK